MNFFSKFPVSRIVPKNVKEATLWDFLNIHSVAKYQKLMGGTIKKFGKKSVLRCRKKEESLIVSKKVDPSYFGMAFYFMLEALDALKMKY